MEKRGHGQAECVVLKVKYTQLTFPWVHLAESNAAACHEGNSMS